MRKAAKSSGLAVLVIGLSLILTGLACVDMAQGRPASSAAVFYLYALLLVAGAVYMVVLYLEGKLGRPGRD